MSTAKGNRGRNRLTLFLCTMALLLLTQCRENTRFYTNTLRSEVFHQLFSDDRYDFLWVFDNSDSMADKREYVKNELNTFLSILNSRKAIDYQMAMTTTDYFAHMGALVQSNDGLEVVKSSSADPVGDFASIISNVTSTFTSFWEQGLESAYQAVNQNGHKFLREGVPLIIIFLTDEEDYSCKANCFGVEPENNTNWVPYDVSRYTDYFFQMKAAENTTVNVFPIVGTPSGSCAVPSFGSRYETLQQATDELTGEEASTGSICTQDLEESYQAIARNIADRGMMFQLAKKASGQGIIVYVDGMKVPYSPDNGYIYDTAQNAIIFTGNAVPDNGATIEIAYSEARD